MGKRIDTPDTLDPVLGLLMRLQAEGWGLASLSHDIDYAAPGEHARRIPVGGTVTVRLVPRRG